MKTQLLNSLQFNGTGQSSLTVIIPFPLSLIPPSHISIIHVDKNEMVLRQQKKSKTTAMVDNEKQPKNPMLTALNPKIPIQRQFTFCRRRRSHISAGKSLDRKWKSVYIYKERSELRGQSQQQHPVTFKDFAPNSIYSGINKRSCSKFKILSFCDERHAVELCCSFTEGNYADSVLDTSST